jgi:predicted nucleotidyltransferase
MTDTERKNNTYRRLREHYIAATDHIDGREVFGTFVFGSQNYGLDDENSDLDSKLLVIPTIKDIASLQPPLSTTIERTNGDHIDIRDVRLFIDNFKSQSHNSLEALFTPFFSMKEDYISQWSRLITKREDIAHINPYKAAKAMQGMAHRNMKLLTSELEHGQDIFKVKGYNPKMLHHILKSEYFLKRYTRGEAYIDCIVPEGSERDFILLAKQGVFVKDEAEHYAIDAVITINKIAEDFCSKITDESDEKLLGFIDEVKEEIVRIGLKKQI